MCCNLIVCSFFIIKEEDLEELFLNMQFLFMNEIVSGWKKAEMHVEILINMIQEIGKLKKSKIEKNSLTSIIEKYFWNFTNCWRV